MRAQVPVPLEYKNVTEQGKFLEGRGGNINRDSNRQQSFTSPVQRQLEMRPSSILELANISRDPSKKPKSTTCNLHQIGMLISHQQYYATVAALLAFALLNGVGVDAQTVPVPPSPGFPPCSVCGEGMRVSMPNVILDVPAFGEITCENFETAGSFGFIDEQLCGPLLTVLAAPCLCVPGGQPTVAPVVLTQAPVVPETEAPLEPTTPAPLAPGVEVDNDTCIQANRTRGATRDDENAVVDDLSCGGPTIRSAGVWYFFVGTGETITIETCTFADFDTQISVFSGPCSNLNCVRGNDDSCGTRSSVQFESIFGAEYNVLVHAFSEDTVGNFVLSLLSSPPTTPAPVTQAPVVVTQAPFIRPTPFPTGPNPTPSPSDVAIPVVAVVFAVIALIFAVFIILRRRRHASRASSSAGGGEGQSKPEKARNKNVEGAKAESSTARSNHVDGVPSVVVRTTMEDTESTFSTLAVDDYTNVFTIGASTKVTRVRTKPSGGDKRYEPDSDDESEAEQAA